MKSAPLTQNSNSEILRMKALEEFNKLKPPLFDGRSDPLAAESWLNSVKTMFESIGVLPEYWVGFAAYLFEGLAEDWWDLKGFKGNSKKISWSRFENKFRRTYISKSNYPEMIARFDNLRQSSNSVKVYRATFDELCSYNQGMLSDPISKCAKFRKGLNVYVRKQLYPFKIADFDELVDVAMRVEADKYLHKLTNNSECFLCGSESFNVCDCPSRQLVGMTVEQYLDGFVELYRLSDPITEADRVMMCIRFRHGLHTKIRSALKVSTIKDFETLVEAAKNAEVVFNRIDRARKWAIERKKYIQQHQYQHQLKRCIGLDNPMQRLPTGKNSRLK